MRAAPSTDDVYPVGTGRTRPLVVGVEGREVVLSQAHYGTPDLPLSPQGHDCGHPHLHWEKNFLKKVYVKVIPRPPLSYFSFETRNSCKN